VRHTSQDETHRACSELGPVAQCIGKRRLLMLLMPMVMMLLLLICCFFHRVSVHELRSSSIPDDEAVRVRVACGVWRVACGVWRVTCDV
jgi:hypothetical protein